jgi:class 3 adenylate cyclase
MLADNIITEGNKLIDETDLYLKPLSYLWLGIAHLRMGQYMESKRALNTALEEAQRLALPEIINSSRTYLGIIEKETGDTTAVKRTGLRNALRSIGSGVNKTTAEMNANANLKLAEYYEKNENYPRAIEYYDKVIEQLRDLGEWERVYSLEEHIAGLLMKDGQLEEAMIAFDDVGSKIEDAEDTVGMQRLQQRKELVRQKMDSTINEMEQVRSLSNTADAEDDFTSAEINTADLLYKAEKAEESEDFEQSLYFFKEYIAMEQKLARDKQAQELALLEKVNEIESRDREITLLKQNEEISELKLVQKESEIDKQRTFKQNLAVGVALLVALALTLYLLYRNKRKDHRKLGVAYTDLETTKDHLEKAEKRIKSLLNQQLSGAVADELLASKDEQEVERRFVCIMFLDIRDFTPFAEKRKPEEIIKYQNQVFGFMIDTVNKHNGIINQIMGDGFMATFGAPVSTDNDCKQAYLAANEIIMSVKEKSKNKEIPPTRVGIGLHAGYVVAGNVGTPERKQYSITGNTVILAARLEQLNKEFGTSLVMSREVYDQLPDELKEPVDFKKVKVKGRSEEMEVASY